MSSPTQASAVVTDEYVVVPASVVDPVVVSFDGTYVWSFVPRRDGGRSRAGWRVPWPAVMNPFLDGTTCVRLADAQGRHVYFEAPVSFRSNADELTLRDGKGNPLAVDSAGHLTRVFSETTQDGRNEIVVGTARAIKDLRETVGIDAHVSYGCLLGAVRDGRMIGHDSDSDLAYLSHHTHPADVVRESFRIEREMRTLGWKVVRMSGADLKLFLPLADGRNVHVDVFGAFHIEGTFYQMGGRSGHLPPRGPDPRVHGGARRRGARRPGRPGAGARVPLRADLAGPGPGLPTGRPLAGRTPPRGLDARRTHPRAAVERDLSQPPSGHPRRAVVVREVDRGADAARARGWSISAAALAGTRPGSCARATRW